MTLNTSQKSAEGRVKSHKCTHQMCL